MSESVCKCGLDRDKARTGVYLRNWGGACDLCGYPDNNDRRLYAEYVEDMVYLGSLMHVFQVAPFMCVGCGKISYKIKVYCEPLVMPPELPKQPEAANDHD